MAAVAAVSLGVATAATAERLTPTTLTASARPLPLHLAISWTDSLDIVPLRLHADDRVQSAQHKPACCPRTRLRLRDVRRSGGDCPASCPTGEYQISAYPAHFDVRGRGTISLAVATASQCAHAGTDILNVSQTFQIVGGTGVFAGASGSGARQSDRHGLHRPRLRVPTTATEQSRLLRGTPST